MTVVDETGTADYAALFAVERHRLLELLSTIDGADWHRPTPCPAWDVAGLCRHLLGDDLYVLSTLRDDHHGTNPPDDLDETTFVTWLDILQGDWVDAAHRISPRLVIELLAWLGSQITPVLQSADPTAVTARVSWASDRPVPMWLEHARELSEYWIHRQQLLQALGRPSDLRADLLGPVLDALRWAYPHRLRTIGAKPGDTVIIDIDGAVKRHWILVAGVHWRFTTNPGPRVTATGRLDADDAWRLLTNNSTRNTVLGLAGEPTYIHLLHQTRAIIGHPARTPATQPSA